MLTFVTQVRATDADSGEHAEIFYEIKNDAEVDRAFAIIPDHSGIISNVLPLDAERTSEYRLQVSPSHPIPVYNQN